MLEKVPDDQASGEVRMPTRHSEARLRAGEVRPSLPHDSLRSFIPDEVPDDQEGYENLPE